MGGYDRGFCCGWGPAGSVEPGAGMVRFRVGTGAWHGAVRVAGWPRVPFWPYVVQAGSAGPRVREACPDSVQPGW